MRSHATIRNFPLAAACIAALSAGASLRAQETAMRDVSLEDLFNIEVTSVSKKAERLQDAAASVYVITQEDIRRSGAVRLQDVLNMVPGIWMADQTHNQTISALRESATLFLQSVNVLLDGVPITSPVTGGVFYGGLQIPLSEIQRIEIIKGPGGTVYGANSATGIISIFTKSPWESTRPYVKIAGGSGSYAEPRAGFGYAFNDRIAVSGYADGRYLRGYDKNPDFAGESLFVAAKNIFGRDTVYHIANAFGSSLEGEHYGMVAGVKLAADISSRMSLRIDLSGQFDRGREYTSLAFPWPVGGLPKNDSVWLQNTSIDNGTVNARLDYAFDSTHQLFCRSYGTYSGSLLNLARSGSLQSAFAIADVEIQDNAEIFATARWRLALTTGANIRPVIYDLSASRPGGLTKFSKPKNTEFVVAGFAQDKLTFGNMIDLTTGIKAETWTLISTTPEISPSARISVHPRADYTVWAAGSRSVTIPGYLQTNIESRQMGLPPAPGDTGHGRWVALVNSDSMRPTVYRTAEAGARYSPAPSLSLDAAGYYTTIDGRIDVAPIDTTIKIQSRLTPGEIISPAYYANITNGRQVGMEGVLRYAPASLARTEVSYALFTTAVEKAFNGAAISATNQGPSCPEHVVRCRIYLDLPMDFHVTVSGLWHSLYRQSAVYDYAAQRYLLNSETIESSPHVKLDLYLEKRLFAGSMAVFIWGRDLLTGNRIESSDFYMLTYPHTVNRMFGGGISYTF